MAWDITISDEFREWYDDLDESEQSSVTRVVGLLEEHGTSLAYPFSSAINNSRVEHMRELRIQHNGRPLRVLYAFDPRRSAYLMLGGDKTGDKRWYETNVKRAEKIYFQHLKEIG